MERVKKFAKFGGLVLTVLLLTAVFSAPVALADSGSGSDGGACPAAENVTVTVENLSGSEANEAVADALSENDVKLLRSELVDDGYTSKVDNAEAVEATVSENGTVISQATEVRIPFKTHVDGVEAGITYTDNGTAERAFATVSGPASVLEEPMDILKENARYQAIVDNLEEQGYTVHEENATVVKIYTPADYASVPGCIEGDVWHTAVINVKAVKGDQVKNITAVVCINKNKVLIVTDFWCEAIMHAICVGGCGGIGGALIYYFPVSAPVAYELVEYCHMMGCPAFADWFCHDFL
ncbi:hypothetical protein AKJ38_00940 [candidate division MSBL1 archaeon SCGC-AAA259I14]|uniref:Uncharacterized protein n=1 Tax=candidate division MSBL1 archaeon SCGC-AAA259I14 TaxID=1698268 RepID=A0A133UTF5_9EURY|nr:hypothetical protein AKJ38_00940 [candidate division MSBL1 archaeon SCGC-AAA259I14]